MAEEKTLSGRREFLFLYDIKMGNPNGDPDENRPRVLPDGTYYVTDVRLKRFARDFLKSRGNDILVDNIEGKTTNLTGRVVSYLNAKGIKQATGSKLVDILLDSFIDARLFGSSFAFKPTKIKDEQDREVNWEAKPEPKTMTGAVQINMGEVLHRAQPVDIHGTSIFGSAEEKGMGTFTTYFGLRYALIAFSGVANEHSAKISRMTDADYELFLKALWHGVRSAANTRTKVGQIPRLLISVDYQGDEEYQLGRLHDYVKLTASAGKDAKEWSSPEDYRLDLDRMIERLQSQSKRIKAVRYCISPDIVCASQLPAEWQPLDAESL
jgi:CRISPR-associated protein Csh2